MMIKLENLAVLREPLEEQLAEYKALQRELARLLTEKDHMVKNIGPQMEAELELKLGVLQFEAESLDCDIRLLKRKLDMILAHYKSAGECPGEESLDEFDTQLEMEFATQRGFTQSRFEKIVSARLLVDSVLSEEERQRMIKVYRRLAKRLHPTINPDLTPEYKSVWEYISNAYRNGELEELETLATLLKSLPGEVTGVPDLAQPEATALLQSRIVKMRSTRRQVREQIRNMKRAHPYRLNYQPKDSGWVEEQCRELQERIRQLGKDKEISEHLMTAVLSGAGRNNLH
ncbi:MAG TPA: hypothetical protein VN611_06870 [Patescibacteria group bacterium]|nr:hypothetical protein [Patescibacteria group bacterium]